MTKHSQDFNDSQLRSIAFTTLSQVLHVCLPKLVEVISSSLDEMTRDEDSPDFEVMSPELSDSLTLTVPLEKAWLDILEALPVSGGSRLEDIVMHLTDEGKVCNDVPKVIAQLREVGLVYRIPDPCGGQYARTVMGGEYVRRAADRGDWLDSLFDDFAG